MKLKTGGKEFTIENRDLDNVIEQCLEQIAKIELQNLLRIKGYDLSENEISGILKKVNKLIPSIYENFKQAVENRVELILSKKIEEESYDF